MGFNLCLMLDLVLAWVVHVVLLFVLGFECDVDFGVDVAIWS